MGARLYPAKMINADTVDAPALCDNLYNLTGTHQTSDLIAITV